MKQSLEVKCLFCRPDAGPVFLPGKRRLGSKYLPLESISSTTCGSGLAGTVGEGVEEGSVWPAGRRSVSGREAVGRMFGHL